MKIYAIPKNQTNTYVPNYKQSNVINTSYIPTKSISSNNCASKVNFCGKILDKLLNIFEDADTVDVSRLTPEELSDLAEKAEKEANEAIRAMLSS